MYATFFKVRNSIYARTTRSHVPPPMHLGSPPCLSVAPHVPANAQATIAVATTLPTFLVGTYHNYAAICTSLGQKAINSTLPKFLFPFSPFGFLLLWPRLINNGNYYLFMQRDFPLLTVLLFFFPTQLNNPQPQCSCRHLLHDQQPCCYQRTSSVDHQSSSVI